MLQTGWSWQQYQATPRYVAERYLMAFEVLATVELEAKERSRK